MKNYVINKSIPNQFTLVFLFIPILLLLYSSYSQATPVITWSPKSVNHKLLPGSSANIPITFNSSENINATNLIVTPELKQFINITPNSFYNINSNTAMHATIVVSVPSNTLFQIKDGTVRLVTENRTISRPLPIVVEISDLPPDPGEAGKSMLEGIDSDGDGVRDDIQRYIVFKYPEDKNIQMGLFQATKRLQSNIIDAQDKDQSILNSKQSDLALICLIAILEDTQYQGQAGDMRKDLRSAFLNTDERMQAFLSYSEHSEGEIFSIPFHLGIEACDFNRVLGEQE